jgi:hypothetical protein
MVTFVGAVHSLPMIAKLSFIPWKAHRLASTTTPGAKTMSWSELLKLIAAWYLNG